MTVKAGDQESDQGGSTAHGVSCWPETQARKDTQSCNCYYFCINDLVLFCGIISLSDHEAISCGPYIIILYINKKQCVGIS